MTAEQTAAALDADDAAATAPDADQVAPRAPWVMPPPPDRAWVIDRSDAPLATDPLPDPPSVAAPPPPGRTLLVDDRGVFVRGPYRPPGQERHGADPDPELPVAVYVHGLAGNSTNFDVLGAVLAERATGYAVDLPGFGRSDPPPGERYSLDDDAEVVATVIERLSPGRPVHLVGNSLGGMLCILLAARRPDLVRTLTLVSPAVPDLRLTADRGADARLGLVLLPGTTRPAVSRLAGITAQQRARGMAELCYGRPERLADDDIRAAAVELAWRFPLRWVHTSTIASLRALIRSYLQFPGSRFRALTRRITAPVLVVWGTHDRLVDAGLGPDTAAGFPDARFLAVPECGHVAMMEEPALTARAVLALWQGEQHPSGPGAPRLRADDGVAPSTA